MNDKFEVRGGVRAPLLAASVAAVAITFGASYALAQAAAPEPGAPGGGAVGAGGNVGQREANPPVAMPGAPDVNLNQVANATGEIRALDKQQRSLTLDNGETYMVDTNLNIDALAPGQRVTITYNLEGGNRKIVKIDAPFDRR